MSAALHVDTHASETADKVLCSEGVLSSRNGEIVVKPCQQSEIDFYESTRNHPELAPYIPDFLGTLSLSDSQSAQAVGAIARPAQTSRELPSTATFAGGAVIENKWTPSNGGKIQTDLAIVLENVAGDFKKPNILDVKLGARLWADDAPPDKRARLDKTAGDTTTGSLAFRIAGMKTYHGHEADRPPILNVDGYKLFDKTYGRAFDANTVCQGFEEFFLLPHQQHATGAVRKVVKRFIADLEGMACVLESEESRMYSASLLFVYEGDPATLSAAFVQEQAMLAAFKATPGISEEGSRDQAAVRANSDDGESDEDGEKLPAIQSLKLIDFAHAQWTPGKGPDENILRGIRNVTKILSDLIS